MYTERELRGFMYRGTVLDDTGDWREEREGEGREGVLEWHKNTCTHTGERAGTVTAMGCLTTYHEVLLCNIQKGETDFWFTQRQGSQHGKSIMLPSNRSLS